MSERRCPICHGTYEQHTDNEYCTYPTYTAFPEMRSAPPVSLEGKRDRALESIMQIPRVDKPIAAVVLDKLLGMGMTWNSYVPSAPSPQTLTSEEIGRLEELVADGKDEDKMTWPVLKPSMLRKLLDELNASRGIKPPKVEK